MEQSALLSISIVSSGLLTWLLTSASLRWRRGRGLWHRPAVVRMENAERLWQAKAHRAQGCREMLRALGQFLLAAMLVFLLAMLLGGHVGP